MTDRIYKMKLRWRGSHMKRIILILVLLILVYVARTVGYLISEYVIRSHIYSMSECRDRIKANAYIPDYIHQIYFPIKKPSLSTRNQKKVQTWKDFHPMFTHRLWNESAVIDLIKRDHPSLLPLYNSYGHWVQRIDVAKYVILYSYGGWYVDVDINCKQSVNRLTQNMSRANKSVVVHEEDTIGPATDFFGVTPHHPFVKFILEGLPNSNRWFLLQHTTIMFSTGPSYIWGRYLNYPCPDEILILSLDDFAKYARLSHDNSWWGQDSRYIYYSLDHKLRISTIAISVCLILFLFCKTKSCIYNYTKRKYSLYRQGTHHL